VRGAFFATVAVRRAYINNSSHFTSRFNRRMNAGREGCGPFFIFVDHFPDVELKSRQSPRFSLLLMDQFMSLYLDH
jgi:hypothetical protein